MKCVWNGWQRLTNQVKTPPEREHSEQHPNHVDDSGEVVAFRKRWFCKLRETLGAEQAVVMLADAFAAEKAPAIGAPRRRLAGGVIRATLFR